MTKKSRRARKRSRQPRLTPSQMVRPDQGERLEVRSASPTAGRRGLPDLRDEYRYVLADLKRIAVIAAVMLVVMIVLALVVV